MQKPNLARMWETFIKIGLPQETSLQQITHIIRSMIYHAIRDLKARKVINWYHFLIHNKESGVPTTKDDENLYFHIRVALEKDVEPKDFRASLPDYCVMTRPIDRRLESISGIDKSLIKNEEIEEVWRIVGEQSEWIIKMVNIHKENVEIPIPQITQFMHFYLNMLGLGGRATMPARIGSVYRYCRF